MRLGLELQVSFFRVGAVVIPECPLNIDRMGIVSFDQVAVVAVHRPHQLSQRGQHAARQSVPETGRTPGKFDRKVGQFGAQP